MKSRRAMLKFLALGAPVAALGGIAAATCGGDLPTQTAKAAPIPGAEIPVTGGAWKGPYMIGEQGPELVTLPRSGQDYTLASATMYIDLGNGETLPVQRQAWVPVTLEPGDVFSLTWEVNLINPRAGHYVRHVEHTDDGPVAWNEWVSA